MTINVGYRMSLGLEEGVSGEGYYTCKYPFTFIEWALPHRFNDYCERYFDGTLKSVANFISGSKAYKAVSVHAPAGRLSSSDSLDWIIQVMILAGEVGARWITVHPNNFRDELSDKEQAVRVVKHLNSLRCEQKIAVETFLGRKRVITIEDIMSYNFPMVLDTSHVESYTHAKKLLSKYYKNIPTIHLSAKIEDVQHQRLDEGCYDIIKHACSIGWSGSIILEYMPDLHQHMEEDALSLLGFIRGL